MLLVYGGINVWSVCSPKPIVFVYDGLILPDIVTFISVRMASITLNVAV